MAWDVNGEQVLEKTGKPLEHWRSVLDAFGGRSKAPRNMVGHLERTHRLPRFWAETLTSWYTTQRR